MLKEGIIDKIKDGVRVLGNGEMKFAATIKASHFSQQAKQKIEASGGKWETI